MDSKIQIKQEFDILEDKIFFENLYSKCRLEILASEIRQAKKQIKFNLKKNVTSSF